MEDITNQLWQNAMRSFGEVYQPEATPAALTPENVNSKFTMKRTGGATQSDAASQASQQSLSGQQINLGNSGSNGGGYQGIMQQVIAGGIGG